MDRTELGNLTLLARIAYAVMCFERYVEFMYSDMEYKPVAAMLWRMVDGSQPLDRAAEVLGDMIPEELFTHKTYEAYQQLGNNYLTPEQHRMLTRTLNPDDWSLNSMMKQICQIMTAYSGTEIKPGAPETLPFLVNVSTILKMRAIKLPELSLLQAYTCPQEEEGFDWMGGPIDPAPLSLFGITASAEAPVGSAEAEEPVTHPSKDDSSNFAKSEEFAYQGNQRTVAKKEIEDAVSGIEKFVRPSVEANGCRWEFIEDPEGCIITRCINISLQKEVTIPSELDGRTVVEIDNNAFSNDPDCGCMLIETLNMPDTIRRIGDGFFKSCTGIRQVRFPAALESIGHEAFRGASRLERIDIGDQCQVIGDYFCADAVSLQTVRIGAGIDYIGEYTFYNTPAMLDFRCDGMLGELGYGSFWVNRWADKILFHPTTEMLRFCKDNALLYRYVKRNPPPRLFLDPGIRYVYDFAFGGDAWHSGDGIRDIYLPGAEKIGVHVFRKTPHATVHLSASKMAAAYGPDYEYTLATLCEPAKVVFDQP